MVKVDPFLVERFLNVHEHNVEVNLAETCVQPFTLGEFLTLVDREDFFEDFKDTQLTYGYIEGSPGLRRGISDLYEGVPPENVLVTGGAIAANFLAFYSLVEPGDTVVSIKPSYQQLYSAAKSFGAEVKLLNLRPEDDWLPAVDELSELVDEKTKMVVINNPHNPTGALIDTPLLEEIRSIAEDAGAYILSDESYRGLYIDPKDHVPSVVEVSENGIATGSFSKPFSLTGLRLGWIAASEEVIGECMLHRDYTTISKGVIDDALAALAMGHVDKIMERNLGIVRRNFRVLSDWVEGEPLIDWVPARAGSVAFLKHSLPMSSEELCLKLIREKSTLMVPGSCFEMEGYIRIGFGNKTEVLKEGLARLKDFLDAHR